MNDQTPCPSVIPARIFPKDSKRPRGAAVDCPHCSQKHWFAPSAASNLHQCPVTGLPFVIDTTSTPPTYKVRLVGHAHVVVPDVEPPCPRCMDHYESGLIEGERNGYKRGIAAVTLNETQRAEFAARKFAAASQVDDDIKRDMELTRQWYDVEKARNERRQTI